jgi:hypothetical protein
MDRHREQRKPPNEGVKLQRHQRRRLRLTRAQRRTTQNDAADATEQPNHLAEFPTHTHEAGEGGQGGKQKNSGAPEREAGVEIPQGGFTQCFAAKELLE